MDSTADSEVTVMLDPLATVRHKGQVDSEVKVSLRLDSLTTVH